MTSEWGSARFMWIPQGPKNGAPYRQATPTSQPYWMSSSMHKPCAYLSAG